jgi:hypothetical protein
MSPARAKAADVDVGGLSTVELVAVLVNDTAAYPAAGTVEVPAALEELRERARLAAGAILPADRVRAGIGKANLPRQRYGIGGPGQAVMRAAEQAVNALDTLPTTTGDEADVIVLAVRAEDVDLTLEALDGALALRRPA